MTAEGILQKLDGYLHRNDYDSARLYLLDTLLDAEKNKDVKTIILVKNELMGLYRKLGDKDNAVSMAESAIEIIYTLGLSTKVGSATTFLNCATVYKAFNMADKALPLYEKAKIIYEKELSENDERLAGLYNNMALALVDLNEFSKADMLYNKAISVLRDSENGKPETAITYLNMATAAEKKYGLLNAEEKISEYLEIAQNLLNSCTDRDGNYAFVCEKCASVYGYYGYFLYEKELTERARSIYEGN